jgi:hypothetical protein
VLEQASTELKTKRPETAGRSLGTAKSGDDSLEKDRLPLFGFSVRFQAVAWLFRFSSN